VALASSQNDRGAALKTITAVWTRTYTHTHTHTHTHARTHTHTHRHAHAPRFTLTDTQNTRHGATKTTIDTMRQDDKNRSASVQARRTEREGRSRRGQAAKKRQKRTQIRQVNTYTHSLWAKKLQAKCDTCIHTLHRMLVCQKSNCASHNAHLSKSSQHSQYLAQWCRHA
jgi:hypothetical protein